MRYLFNAYYMPLKQIPLSFFRKVKKSNSVAKVNGQFDNYVAVHSACLGLLSAKHTPESKLTARSLNGESE